MRTLSLCFLGLLLVLSLQAQDITGSWSGVLKVQGIKLPLVINVEEGDDGLTATLDSPDQGAFDIPTESVSFEENKLNVSIPSLNASYEGTLQDDGSIDGDFVQFGASYPLKLTKGEVEVTRGKPQDPVEPLPYYVEEVTFQNVEAGVTLAGTVTLPDEDGVYPVVILISGSGPQNRDEELLGHKPFLVLSDHLTRNGIGVLRYDDRGTAQSTGDFTSATSADFAQDVHSAVDYLLTRDDVDHKNIGLVGHSEGGLIAPMVAAESSDIAYIVLLAGPGIPGGDILVAQTELIHRANGEDEESLAEDMVALRHVLGLVKEDSDAYDMPDSVRTYLTEVYKNGPSEDIPQGTTPESLAETVTKQLTSTWMRYFITYDPATDLARVQCPVLAITGALDLQVPAEENIRAIEASLKKAKNKDVTTKIIPGLNHLFQECETGSPNEYAKIEQTFSPTALDEVSNWILSKVN